MCEALEHRGPDARGVYARGGVGLGSQRLAVIDVEGGNQPVFNEDGSVVLVFNGEIYNYRELRRELVDRGHRFASVSDTEVIAHLYEERGTGCVDRLRGMFAFALWDASRQMLFLARDRLGKKPLFYVETDNGICFASELRSLLRSGCVEQGPDWQAIDAYLQFQYVPDPRTAFAGVKKLMPAHILTWEDGAARLQRYWKLSFGHQTRDRSTADVAEELRHHLLEATRLRLRSDVPLGAFLSGGTDSSAVVAAMARAGLGTTKTFTAGFRESSFDERPRARVVASRYSTEHHELEVTPDAMGLLPQLVWKFGEPFADHSAIPSLQIAETARSLVTVCLTGDGGDEAFAGYPRYFAHRLGGQLRRLPQPVLSVVDQIARRVGPGPVQGTVRHRAHGLAAASLEDSATRYANWLAFFTPAARQRLYGPRMRAVDPQLTLDVIREPMEASDATHATDRLLDVDMQTWLPGDLLTKVDITTMAHSLEARSPLLDHVFLEFAASLPATLKVRGMRGKRIWREALEPWLPESVLDGPKMGFTVPLAQWLRGPLRSLVTDVLLDPKTVDREMFVPAEVERILRAHFAGRADNANKLWALLQLELWMRTFIDAPSGQPLSALDAHD